LWIESIQNHQRDRFQYFEKRSAGGKPLHNFPHPALTAQFRRRHLEIAGRPPGAVGEFVAKAAGGDIPDPALNPKFAHKLQFLDEMKACAPLHPRDGERHVLVGDLNVAPHENDVWSHKQLLKIVSHTPVECEKLLGVQSHGNWVDIARARIPMSEKVYTWWSYRAADWVAANRGRRLDHIWVSEALRGGIRDFRIARDARGWKRPSDHVPVTAVIDI
jgi:exodeoxyribonuclease-3